MTAVLLKLWQPIAGGIVAALAVLYAWIKGKSADNRVAQAQKSESEAHLKVAQMSQAIAEANAKAANSTAQAAQERVNVENEVSSLPVNFAADELRSKWSK